jgi:predicted alpha/beta-hydrolase family hydrolase
MGGGSYDVRMDVLWAGPEGGAATLVLAHSAGAPMDSAWMTAICTLLGDRGIRTARFEFAYMAGRRQGIRRPPPKAELAVGDYRDAVAEIVALAGSPVIIGGKSYGGRVASMVADELHDQGTVSGLVCLGYPFHPPQRPEQLRTAHLMTLGTPALICQGTRDPFGGPDEVAGYGLSPRIEVRWFDGDHDVQSRARLAPVADAVAAFAFPLQPS